jgi:large subunit ribosomal protein L29
MNAEKVRNMTDGELKQQERDSMDQLFRLKFQMKMGQTESLNKIRSLRRGVARLKTIARERQLGLVSPAGTSTVAAKPAKAAKVKAAPVAKSKAQAKAKVKAKAPAKKAATKKSEKK